MDNSYLIWMLTRFFSVFMGSILIMAISIEIYNRFIKDESKDKTKES